MIAAAVCPHPPLLVPQVAAGQEVAARASALKAVHWLVDQNPDLLVLVGDGPDTTSYPPGSVGSFAGFGVQLALALPAAPIESRFPLASAEAGTVKSDTLPLSLSVGAWLLAEVGWAGPTLALSLADDLSWSAATGLGEEAARSGDRVGLLVMGDGSACRTEKAPGWFDERAEAFDAGVTAAFADGDVSALFGLDERLGRELLAAGRASWQFLAGAFHHLTPIGSVLYDDAPFGVQYTVATWAIGSAEAPSG